MKIEAGKYYETRNGQKAFCIGFSTCGMPVCEIQTIDSDFIQSMVFAYRDDNTAFIFGGGTPASNRAEYDLIAPWPETRVVEGWRGFSEDGFISGTSFLHNGDVNDMFMCRVAKFRHTFEGDKLIKVEILEHGDE